MNSQIKLLIMISTKQFPDYLDLPRMCRPCADPIDPVPEVLSYTAVPLGKMLVSAQRDGVQLQATSLLQRQYDDEFGVVDPASDIHTDVHLLQDALIRKTYDSKLEAKADVSE